MKNIKITSQNHANVLNLLLKKLLDKENDFSIEDINEILNDQFEFFKRNQVINAVDNFTNDMLVENIYQSYFYVQNLIDDDIKEIYQNIKQANKVFQNEEKKKYYLEKNHLMLDEIIEYKERHFFNSVKLYASDLYLNGKSYNFPFRKNYKYSTYKIYYKPNNNRTILAMSQYMREEEYQKLEKLKLKNSKEYIDTLTFMINISNTLTNIKKIVNENHILNKRINIFEQIITFFKTGNWEMVINLISIQMEGIFFDYTRFVEMNSNKKASKSSSLKNKILVLKDNHYDNNLLPYFKFDFPDIRNTIAYEGIMKFENIEETAKELILICNNLLGMFTASYLPYNNLIFLFNNIEKDKLSTSFISKIIYGLELYDKVINQNKETNVYKLLVNIEDLKDILEKYKLDNGENAYEYAKMVLQELSKDEILEEFYEQLDSDYELSDEMYNVIKNIAKNLQNSTICNQKQKRYCGLILKKIKILGK